MGKINIEDIQPGMVLLSDVKDHRGLVLLSAGNKITEKNIKIFQMWGITEVNVQGVKKEDIMAEAMAQIDPVLLQEAEKQAQVLFRHTNRKHPAISELFQLCKLRIVRQKLRGDKHGQ